MESARILIAMSSETSMGKLRSLLVESGFTVIDQAKDGHDCLRKARALRPDLIILEYGLSLMNGNEVARVAIEDRICDVILITTESQSSLIEDIRADTGFICLMKPINRMALVNTIELMVKSKRKIRSLEKEIEDLKITLDTRKELEKAKGLLMKHLNLSEAEAFKRIQKQSMDRGIPMKDIAKAIILAYDI